MAAPKETEVTEGPEGPDEQVYPYATDPAPAPDPWKHRGVGMRCITCMWFVKKDRAPKEHGTGRIYDNGTVGRCRRHAPTMNGYPVVFTNDWCGDHKLDEEKVT